MIKLCNRVIEYSFYALFLLVPLVLSNSTYELFEFNKMWLTFALTIIIALAWFTKMILTRQIRVQRTPLDIPILLFLLSQIISTIFSMDSHLSLWGYYSRFNGGLLSTISYIFLYFTFVSNLQFKHVMRNLFVSLIAGFIVALWGFPSHFGYDPTCYLFRGSLDVSCWTDAFQPKVRIFSTLGQPDWLAAYLALLIPLSVAYALKKYFTIHSHTKPSLKFFLSPVFIMLYILTLLFYVDLTFTLTKAGFDAFWLGIFIFWIILFIKQIIPRNILLICFSLFTLSFLILNFFFGIPIGELYKFTLPVIQAQQQAAKTNPSTQAQPATPAQSQAAAPAGDLGSTDSGKIRLFVWQGAIDVWKNYPLFGSGVETFAFAYYKYRPVGHNETSEWDFLYNKAHNEYLNYLATTGIFGLGTYLVIIFLFLYLTFKHLLQTKDGDHTSLTKSLLITGLVAGYITILITNFFGFSVVIMNEYLFLIPVFVFILGGMLPDKALLFDFGVRSNKSEARTYPINSNNSQTINLYQWTLLLVVLLLALFSLFSLYQFWDADTAYALGHNFDQVGQYQQGYAPLLKAVNERPGEPVFSDELSVNNATLALAFFQQKDTAQATDLANRAITISNQLLQSYPNNIVFLKSRVRVFYALSEINSQYIAYALDAMQRASVLAPTDAKIWYNLGVLYGETGQTQKGIDILNRTIQMKPDYQDAYFALGLFYHQAAVDKKGVVINPPLQAKAIGILKYVLTNLNSNNTQVKKTLKSWGAV